MHVLFLLLMIGMASCSTENPLEHIMQSGKKEIAAIIKNQDQHAIQIRYTQIQRDSLNRPLFKSFEFGVDESRYFYPASTAKLPIAILSLQRLRELQAGGIAVDIDTPFRIKDPQTAAIVAARDSTHPQQQLTVSHLIKKIFLVSDNDAYNYLFDFLGRDYINTELQKRGFTEVQIHHKFLLGADNVNSWEYEFFEGKTVHYKQESRQSHYTQTNEGLDGVLKGRGFMKDGILVQKPMDFQRKNRLSIRSLEALLKRVLFPEIYEEQERFGLLLEDYTFLRYWMSRNTLESESPRYTLAEGYYDSYVKFLIYGDQPGQMSSKVRIYNKVGDAYGTLTDTAYIEDKENGIEFLLTATILVNTNAIFNDDIYEYDRLGFPFLGELGRQVLEWEQKRKQAHRPAL